ncbi:RimK family protein [Rhodospirillum rubrum]|uniref:ATP-grasp domain-containing protein n=1 Tax=Rhodospirillum rubrum (strain ATCC 11170 / ATH 1.1.1 / DSM 467 / LMG 4362 / NCIMB 8255 / S1) TaxID=269796 RepID=Q2RQN4_RHORT|nr:RimK family protein [Rhodospirillum rubrum]ABC23561.1 conserved hypothetical protein [Rhodospirillum rubrum ATCC 11170]AEO49299.1 hypothetical protein F11_14185 [Rhodospirillum rubrum F11]MBK5955235.1 hypothetical protein [Rhodospirillum rubrum]QXG79527.1 RimK family protein [Rhodospirillum rubrum]HAQ00128.1 hypothetical protein [Rhodospirillum rubrum]
MLFILSERKPETFPADVADLIVAPREFISRPALFSAPGTRIINLASDCSYLGLGYYASLLAAARGLKVLPAVAAIVNLNRKSLRQILMRGLNDALDIRMGDLGETEAQPFEVFIAFGATPDARFGKLARQVWEAFQFPLMVMTIAPVAGGSGWQIQDIEPRSAKDLPEDRESFFQEQLAKALKDEWKPPKPRKAPKWSLAVLYNREDPLPPSTAPTLRKLSRAAARAGVEVEVIGKKDLPRLAEFDALFIRETTNVNHHTFTFARTAEENGMPVIDDSLSILRCTNKVYLAELLAANNLPTPETRVIDRQRLKTVERYLSYPIVLKIPDGSFSRGVVKVEDRAALLDVGHKLLGSSDLILAQEFVPTAFDWRVGVLNGQPLFVCQYLMSRKHWQIVNHNANGKTELGSCKTLDIDQAPHEVIALALRAANLMGNGLYGVDIKQTEKGCLVIEVNDNPNIDTGIEDQVLKGALYDTLIGEFVRRLEEARS